LSSTTGANFATSSGNVGIGTLTPTEKLDVNGTVKATAFSGPINGTVGATTPSTAVFTTATATGLLSDYWTSTGANPGLSGKRIAIDFDATSTGRVFVLGADASTNGIFTVTSLRSDGSNSVTALTVTSTGLDVTGEVRATASGGAPIILTGNASAVIGLGGTSSSFVGIRANSGSEVGVIIADQSAYAPIRATAFNVDSDARLKTNIRDYSPGALIDSLQPRIFDWKSGEKDSIGFVAQELQAVYPQAVTAGDDGEEIAQSWGVDFSKLVPLLVAEVKSLRARVAQLESNA
jgi:hypothetical protein